MMQIAIGCSDNRTLARTVPFPTIDTYSPSCKTRNSRVGLRLAYRQFHPETTSRPRPSQIYQAEIFGGGVCLARDWD